ncbi:hypothetical protein TrVE_jg2734 [Triparma verrucosa]|uniref:Aspergillus nuclease S(1) n=1 Tax=Triparma verrucosa TaxID=1606542 RepID=A0A9W7FNV7_9STRA|nr:hypothetical protein TrVE_jg2734 [Triparma verrucosa]
MLFNHFFPATILVLVLVASKPQPSVGWGSAGHRLVGHLADSLLSDGNATSFLQEILGNETLMDVANWADTVTKSEPWSMPLHFINVQSCSSDSCVFVPSRDCPNDMCVSGAVNNYTSRTLNRLDSTSAYDDLRFLVHFLGDIHQPLHCAKDSDKGGNTIKPVHYDVTDQGSEFSLHQIWDFGIIENVMSEEFNGDVASYGGYLLSLLQTDFEDEVEGWKCDVIGEKQCSEKWGQESVDMAMEYSYLDASGNFIHDEYTVEEEYVASSRKVIEKRLAQGGVRLANIIESIVEKQS